MVMKWAQQWHIAEFSTSISLSNCQAGEGICPLLMRFVSDVISSIVTLAHTLKMSICSHPAESHQTAVHADI